MKATVIWASALVGIAVSAAPALANYPAYCSPVLRQRLGIAPDATGPGYYFNCPNYYPATGTCCVPTTVFGPNYNVYPPFPPFNGVLPGRQNQAPAYGQGPGAPPNVCVPAYGAQPGQPAAYPYHPYMRSPRDFFMWREAMEDNQRRGMRPDLVP